MKPLFLLFSVLIYANVITATSPEINLFLPETNYRSEKNKVLFKGTIKNATHLTINGQNIALFNQRFYQKATLNPHQTNVFTVTAFNENTPLVSITRKIEFFPTQNITQEINFKIEKLSFNPNTNLWEIEGKSNKLKAITINDIPIPISKSHTFSYKISPQDILKNKKTLTISGINKNRLLFTQNIALYEKNHLSESKETQQTKPLIYQHVEKAILSSFSKKDWRQIPFTTIQKKMINELITTTKSHLNFSHIQLIQNKESLVATLPYIQSDLSIQNISHQLMLIFQNTVDFSPTISILWYNKNPDIIEIVYTNNILNQNQYWLINDKSFKTEDSTLLNQVQQFKKHGFSSLL